MEALTPVHLALIVLAFVLLFGYRKLPDASRSIGRSLRIFRSEMRATADDPTAAPSPAELEAAALQADAEAAALRERAAQAAGPEHPAR